MKRQVTVAALAKRLGITRSNLHKRIRREGVKTSRVFCVTGGGVQTLTTVPLSFAKRLIQQYEEAKANAASEAVLRWETAHTRGTT